MKTCPKCAAQYANDAKICRVCGRILEDSVLAKLPVLVQERQPEAPIEAEVSPITWLSTVQSALTSEEPPRPTRLEGVCAFCGGQRWIRDLEARIADRRLPVATCELRAPPLTPGEAEERCALRADVCAECGFVAWRVADREQLERLREWQGR